MMTTRDAAIFAPPVREYDGSRTMRSLADAIDKLRDEGALCEGESVEIRTLRARLPDRLGGSVLVLGPRRPDGDQRIIRMPSAAKFTAKLTCGEQQDFDIVMLNGAVSDCSGNVQLITGEFLHQIDLVPVPYHYELNSFEEAIVRLAIEFLQIEDLCFVSADEELFPGLVRLRYDVLAQVRVKDLKVLHHYINKGLRQEVSQSIVSKALKRAGMKLPRSRSAAFKWETTVLPLLDRE